ncbi:MAG: hypothetical protein KKA73_07915 [Chloroflexi bacterium]|nr:hypothetical protein [Chloroflexota bacterium]MBU1747599.1 hypothetical protein [Chloroflexota bacterium]
MTTIAAEHTASPPPIPLQTRITSRLRQICRSVKVNPPHRAITIHTVLFFWWTSSQQRPPRFPPLADLAAIWNYPGVIHLGRFCVGRLVKPVSGPPPADPPTLTSAAKWQRWIEFGQCLPFLRVEKPGSLAGRITYAGQPLFEYPVPLFHVAYGLQLAGRFQPLFTSGGSRPWDKLCYLNPPGRFYWGPEIEFNEDDRTDDAPVFYRTAVEKQVHTARFWSRVDEAAWRVRDLAWRELLHQVRARQLWPALIAARQVAGTIWWLNRYCLPLHGRHESAIRRLDGFLQRQITAVEQRRRQQQLARFRRGWQYWRCMQREWGAKNTWRT